jgi:hypothetical protein
VLRSSWQCCHHCGSAAIVVAVLPPLLQCCHRCGSAAIVSGSAAIVVAVLPSLVAVLPSLSQCCHRLAVFSSCGCAVNGWLCFHREVFYLFRTLAAFL